jgi:acyl-CoA synthetase (AMP-forming)/AMP-acid ligase II
MLGQEIHVIATPPDGEQELDAAALLADCRVRMPGYMWPARVHAAAAPLPRNPNGKIDRKQLAATFAGVGSANDALP